MRINLLINFYLKIKNPDKITDIILKLPNDFQGSKIKGGLLIDHYCKQQNLEKTLVLYEKLTQFNIEFISSTYTSIIKCFIAHKKYRQALDFFNSIKHNKDLTGFLITYNCALNVYTFYRDSFEAELLFEELDRIFQADIVSYGTIIKILCNDKKHIKAFQYLTNLIETNQKYEISSICNNFLESCANKMMWKLGFKAWNLILEKNLAIDEITFGIVVKFYQHSKNLSKAFELLALMKQKKVEPTVIFFTNLIHISFGLANWEKAQEAFTLCNELGIPKDSYIYSKFLKGLIYFKKYNLVEKYLQQAIDDRIGLQQEIVQQISLNKNYGNIAKLLDQL